MIVMVLMCASGQEEREVNFQRDISNKNLKVVVFRLKPEGLYQSPKTEHLANEVVDVVLKLLLERTNKSLTQ